MPFVKLAAGLSAGELVDSLADRHRGSQALDRLIALGPDAVEPACAGLRHPDAKVRARCCRVLDHIMDEASVGAIIGALADPAPEVRCEALHALACDRCKAGSCRPGAALVLPPVLAILAADPSPHVRAYAAEVVGVWAHTRQEAADALREAAVSDPSPAVRKKASWFAPGGTIFVRTKPRGQ
jgi:HEAT repeat protein